MSDDSLNGHRIRLRESYIKGGPDALTDVAMLELLLTFSIPRKDVKPISRSLISHFGSLEGVFRADRRALCKVDGVGANTAIMISITKDIICRIRHNKLDAIKTINNATEAINYCQSLLQCETTEKVAVISLDNNNKVINSKIISDGTVKESEVSARKLMETVIYNNTSKIIITHNHPSGNVTPSAADINFTIRVREFLKPIGIDLVDHIIVGTDNALSMHSKLAYNQYFDKRVKIANNIY